jgi:parallel beta-helix repeat protein
MRARLVAFIGVSATTGMLLTAPGVPAGAAGVVTVDPGGSIQAAVDQASPGTTIVVRPGTYHEHVTITTDGIKLVGLNATLVPPADHPETACSFGGPATDGICAVGEISFPDPQGPPVVDDPVSNVTISGFTVSGFEGTGILYLGAENPVITGNRVIDNGGYGIARFISSGGSIIANRASGSAEAGIYVGDSPNANVLIAANESSGNELFGFFLRDAANGTVTGNRSHDNCVGAIVLNTGAGVAGNWSFKANLIQHNNAACPADEEEGTPPLSGIGIAIAGGHDNSIVGNVITGNVPSIDVPFSGGVVVINPDIPGAEPTGNVVRANVIQRNQPDIFTDGSGSGNVFADNSCRTSVPDGLC